MRIGIVGGGVAGALLAWRLRRAWITVDLYLAAPVAVAPGASGGLVRGFERAPDACQLAAASLVELRDDPSLREAAAYREIGSVYLLPPGYDPTGSIRVVDELLPGSATVLSGAGLPGDCPLRDLPAGAVAVIERHAGFLSPAGLRAAALGWLADSGVAIRPVPVMRLDTAPSDVGSVPTLRLADGTTAVHDVVVVAAGAWTPALLAASGLAADGYPRQIQYSIFPARLPGLGAFVDDLTGLYGRPAGDGSFLLGLPCDRRQVDPDAVRPDRALVERVADQARRRLGVSAVGDRPDRTVASSDCYQDPPGLVLREVAAGAAVFTFTGGSGGAAKTVLAASRAAASALLAH